MIKKRVVSLDINTGNYDDMTEEIIKLSANKVSSYICISNVHMTIEAYQNESFFDIVNNADIATPDGMPLAKAMKLLYGLNQDRVAGMDLMPDLMKFSQEQELSIFLYGSTGEILSKIITKARKEYPKLKLNSYSPPFRELSTKEKDIIINDINEQNPNFVFVALGCPKQEKWMAEHKGKINSCMIGLGGVFEVYAGTKSRAPKWMQQYSLEWLHRLAQDPKRLWKRYLVTNTLFIILLLGQIIKVKLLQGKE